MGVHPLDMPADQVTMPGDWGMSFTVAAASDADLARQLDDSLAIISEQVVSTGFTPTDDGLTPDGWFDHANAHRHLHATESVVRRNERLARTIRREQADRAARAKAENAQAKQDARDRLEGIVTDAPAEAARLVAHAQEVVAASDRIRGIVADLRMMGGSGKLAQSIAALADGANTAADALGQPRPDMPTAPDGLPTSSEISEVMAVFIPGKGFDRSYSVSTDASRAADLARKLKG